MMRTSLARRLRVIRAGQGLTVRQAAEKAGVRAATLTAIEHGRVRPQDATLGKLARAYGIPVEILIEEHEESAPLTEAPQVGAPVVDLEQLHTSGVRAGDREVAAVNNALADLWVGTGETTMGCLMLSYVLSNSSEFFEPAVSEALQDKLRALLSR